MEKNNLNNLIAGDWLALIKDVQRDERFLNADYELLMRIFLEKAKAVPNPYSLKTSELREYLKHVEEEDAPPDTISDLEFFQLSAKQWLQLDDLPRNKFFALYEKARKDIRKIDQTIEGYNQKITDIDRTLNERHNETYLYEKHMLQHYKSLNEEAREEIVNFIIVHLPSKAAQKATRSLITPILDFPYRYSVFPDLFYNADYVSDLSNKFLDLSLSDHKRMRTLLQESPESFLTEAQNYTRNRTVTADIRSIIDSNHLVNRRKGILNEALAAFDQGNLLLFIHAVAPQIEGLFHDFCLDNGLPATQLSKESMTDKMKRLESAGLQLANFEYYAYRFPLTRNKIAHGRYLGESKELTAIMLLLDLLDVCAHVASDQVFLNKVASFFKELRPEALDLADKLRVLALYTYDLPDFYETARTNKRDAELKLEFDEFWKSLPEAVSHYPSNVLRTLVNKFSNIRSKFRSHEAIDAAQAAILEDIDDDSPLLPQETMFDVL